MDTKQVSAKEIGERQLRLLLQVAVWIPKLIASVENGGGPSPSADVVLGVRRLSDGRRVRLKLVAELTDPHGGASTPSPAERDAYRRQQG